MRKRATDTSRRRDILIRSLLYGTLAALVCAAAVSGTQLSGSTCLRDIAFIEGRPATLTGYGLLVGLQGTGDGSKLAHTNKSLLATLTHLGIDPQGAPVEIGEVAAVLVQAEFPSGMDVGMITSVRVTALNDATDLTGGRLLPMTLVSRDGRFRGTTTNSMPTVGLPGNSIAAASGVIEKALVCSTSVFMTDLPGQDFILEMRGLSATLITDLAECINLTFGQIAYAHSGCDIEIKLPASYADFSERASLVAQIAAMPVDDIVPALIVGRDDVAASAE